MASKQLARTQDQIPPTGGAKSAQMTFLKTFHIPMMCSNTYIGKKRTVKNVNRVLAIYVLCNITNHTVVKSKDRKSCF